MVAITLGIWKFKYLFHDWYKPWMKMFGFKYETIQKYHKTHSRHHIEYLWNHSYDYTKLDIDAMIIDWECSQYTKEMCDHGVWQEYEEFRKYYPSLDLYMLPRIKELGLIKGI